MLTVVAAVIECDGKILACQRRRNGSFALKWEFPGGKVKPGETPEAALRRELQEELGVVAAIGAEVYRTRHRYPEMDRELELIFFQAQAAPSQIRNLAFESMLWVEPADLASLDFLEADRELIVELGRNSKAQAGNAAPAARAKSLQDL
jgi:8-oxo-dGTP diphosphatase